MTRDANLFSSKAVWDQQMQLGQRNLVEAILDFWPSEDVRTGLDVGCGDGKLTHIIAERTGCSFSGLDSSAEALSRLRLNAVLADAARMPIADDSFDLVLTTDTLEHIPGLEHERVWGELFRVASRYVLVAVPFREELLDATARCNVCNSLYHVNWHLRRYDLEDFPARAPNGWVLKALVATGEQWPNMLSEETQFRREVLDEWSGWEDSTCPSCGVSGQPAQPAGVLSPILSAALGTQIYQNLNQRRQWRSHSEILAIYSTVDGEAESPADQAAIDQHRASEIPETISTERGDLIPYPQVARRIRGSDTGIAQFPLYGSTDVLRLNRRPGSQGNIHGVVEDGLGVLYDGPLLKETQQQTEIRLQRTPVPGYYGVLLRSVDLDAIEQAELGRGPIVGRASGTSSGSSYFHPVSGLWVQTGVETWFDPAFLSAATKTDLDLPHLLKDAENLDSRRSKEVATLLARLQNLETASADLHKTAEEHQQALVRIQNLEAENSSLREIAELHERLQVRMQNLEAERIHLLQRSAELERRLVEIQNLEAFSADLQSRVTDLNSSIEPLTERNRLLASQVSDLEARLEVRLGTRARSLVQSIRATEHKGSS